MNIPDEVEVQDISTILHRMKPKNKQYSHDYICLSTVMTETGLSLDNSKLLCEFLVQEGMLEERYTNTGKINKVYTLDQNYNNEWIVWI